MADSPEKVAALAKLAQLVQELEAAQQALAQWQDRDMNRRDGSTRQDNMHEEDGREARDRVWSARNAVDAQQKLIASFP
ncbi:hypothetical protein QMK54_29600 [Pseudomonas sp. P5_109]|uniref:hypothetical protein n=1 Tax=Pseudomonas sp. P5_109 TaxID=3043441 RepID=UPI002A3650B4|nr:hypothetical protein [Pseudomonas sp. P5_109]WPN29899.1 hypothetical protein QMK54_29600 [Pseudomonas sp. P5_109]